MTVASPFTISASLNEMIESSDGFNGWLEGMELMGKGNKKGVVNAKNAVVNGFKSIFT